jgi:predicted aspartyl protease
MRMASRTGGRGRETLAVLAVLAMMTAACMDAPAPERVEIAGDEPETGVAIRMAGPGGAALVVPVHINGTGPHEFVLDTGATMTCVDAALADRLELPEAAGQRGVGMGIGQEAGALRLIRMDSIRIGDATATAVTGCALDLGRFREIGLEIHGLLGLNVLQEFTVTLDFRAERLTLGR